MPFNPPIPDPKGRNKPTGMVGAIVQAEKLIQIALVLPCAAFIGWLGGEWIGSRMHKPWIAAVGVAFGGAAGLYYVIRLALDSLKGVPEDESAQDDGKGSAGKSS